jgi:methyl-accepting chemotaxis protein
VFSCAGWKQPKDFWLDQRGKGLEEGESIMSLRGKVILLLVIALTALAVVSAGNYLLRKDIQNAQELQAGINTALAELQESRVAERAFLQEGEPKLADKALSLLQNALSKLDEQKKKASQEEVIQSLEGLSSGVSAYREVFSKVVANVKRINQLRTEMLASGKRLDEQARTQVVGFLDEKEGEMLMETGTGLDDMHINFRNGVKDYRYFITQLILNSQRLYLEAKEAQYLAERKIIEEGIKLQGKNTDTLLSAVKFDEPKKAWAAITKESNSIVSADQKLHGLWKSNRQAMAKMEAGSVDLTKKADALDKQNQEEMEAKSTFADLLGIGVFLVAAVLLLAGGMVIIRTTFSSLRGAVGGLNDVASEVGKASEQFSGSSNDLASGASEQAASLEETAASLEELSSMTKQSAEHARQADQLMQEAGRIVEQANHAMESLREAMGKISTNSDETAHIIKTIDEIAFQTNLLALNAAVEAARAGEAGAGFAVVADEVRSLAMRAAEAAKNTQDLIEQNIHDVKTGGEMVKTTDEAFSQVEESAQKVGGLVSEIAAASEEQAQGIDQINKATAEMDKVTQRVAGNAEETASASEELSGQVGALTSVVDDLAKLLGGSKQRAEAVEHDSDEEMLFLPDES